MHIYIFALFITSTIFDAFRQISRSSSFRQNPSVLAHRSLLSLMIFERFLQLGAVKVETRC